jgi:rubrerythrin
LDAVSLYEQLAAMTENENIRKVLMDIAKEEKTHVGEFEALLLKEDQEQAKESEEGKKEVEELTE